MDNLFCPSPCSWQEKGSSGAPSFFEKRGVGATQTIRRPWRIWFVCPQGGVSFQSWISKSLNTGHHKMDFFPGFGYNGKNPIEEIEK